MFESERKFPVHFAPVGILGQPHGLKGEINITLDSGYVPDEGDFVFVDIDSTMIPLQVASIRQRTGDAFIVAFTGYDSDGSVKPFRGLEVSADADIICADNEEPDEDVFYIEDLVGYSVLLDGKPYGTVEGFDDSTDNALLIVKRNDNRDIMIPFADQFITGIDSADNSLTITLPEGYDDLF